MLNEMGAGTVPITPIEMPIDMPLPEGCACAWGFDAMRRVKYVKFLHANCGVYKHRLAFADSHMVTPLIVSELPQRRGRGRPRNEQGQWHQKGAARRGRTA